MINIEKNKKLFCQLLNSTGRANTKNLINYLKREGFFEAPASSKFHLNVPGGLVEHSLTVYDALGKLNTAFLEREKRIPLNSVIISALLHDVCKIDNYHLFENKETNQKEYKREDLNPIGHGEKSVILILQQGFPLTATEIAMIRWHMAMYDPAYARNSKDVKKIYPEAKLLYFADDIATQYLEEGGRSGDSDIS